jgi:hypothetical protein
LHGVKQIRLATAVASDDGVRRGRKGLNLGLLPERTKVRNGNLFDVHDRWMMAYSMRMMILAADALLIELMVVGVFGCLLSRHQNENARCVFGGDKDYYAVVCCYIVVSVSR